MPLRAATRVPTTALKGVDHQVEHKITVEPEDAKRLARALDLQKDDDDLKRRDVYFFDTPDLALSRAGVILRARREDGDDDTTVKVRGDDAFALAAPRKDADGFKLEVDRGARGDVPAASFTADAKRKAIDAVVGGERSPQILFTPAQERMIEDALGARPPWRRLQVLGPAEAAVWKKKDVDGVSEAVVVERWRLPDGQEIVEVSARSDADEAAKVGRQLRRFLRAHDVDAASAGETKTSATMAYFAGRGAR